MNSVQLLNFERTSCDALEVFFFSNKGKIKSHYPPRRPPIEHAVVVSTVVSQNWYTLFYFLNEVSVWDLQKLVYIWKSHKNRLS